MRTECLLCEAPVIRPGSIAHSKEWLLCPMCRAELQAKVNYAVRRIELEMVNGPTRRVKRRRWYDPVMTFVVVFLLGVAMMLFLYAIGWWK
jgi:hypothetical protein